MKFNVSKNKFKESSAIRDDERYTPIPNNNECELDISGDANLTIAISKHEALKISEPNDDIWVVKMRILGVKAQETYHDLNNQ